MAQDNLTIFAHRPTLCAKGQDFSITAQRLLLAALLCLTMLVVQMVSLPAAQAQDRGSAEEAVAMVKRAQEAVRRDGLKPTIDRIQALDPQFKDRDLYVFIISLDGTMVAHGVAPALVGKPLAGLRDADRKLFIQEFMDLASANQNGWIDYKWPSPATNTVQFKSSYIERLGRDYLVGVGIYKGEIPR